MAVKSQINIPVKALPADSKQQSHFLRTGEHSVSDERIVNCRKKREKKSDIKQPDEERRRNLSGIEEEDKKRNHDLEHRACFSEQ